MFLEFIERVREYPSFTISTLTWVCGSDSWGGGGVMAWSDRTYVDEFRRNVFVTERNLKFLNFKRPTRL